LQGAAAADLGELAGLFPVSSSVHFWMQH